MAGAGALHAGVVPHQDGVLPQRVPGRTDGRRGFRQFAPSDPVVLVGQAEVIQSEHTLFEHMSSDSRSVDLSPVMIATAGQSTGLEVEYGSDLRWADSYPVRTFEVDEYREVIPAIQSRLEKVSPHAARRVHNIR